ncbi:hypothetical protein BDZ97DRAFT_1283300 [Flammula alnicola]|nr:hypothetical protein BDZ97DRAFT_1283300 [Flammula alnicola]
MAPSENHHDARSRRRIKSAGGDSTPELGEGLENVLGPPNCEKSSGGRSLPVKFASAFDLVDEECHNHPSRSEAQVLLSALEQFIRSTIHAQPMQNRPQQSDNKLDAGTLNKNGPLAGGSPNSTASSDNLPSPIDKERHARSSSRSEAQVLLSALEAFIQSNIRGPFAREGAPESDNKPVSANPECLLNNKEFLASGSSGRAPLVGCSLDKGGINNQAPLTMDRSSGYLQG